MKIRLADLVIEINNKFEYVEALCKNYLTNEQAVDFSVDCTDADIESERLATTEEGVFSDEYLESLAIYRKICLRALEYDAFLMHSAIIEVYGQAYAFLARSGTGKSTHISLWRKVLGDKVQIINGDKPILRYIDGELYAYGTPWCGKEGWNRNTRARLKALCYIERAPENSIEKISTQQSATRLMQQILIPSDAKGAIKTLELVDKMISDTQSWLLKCNISEEAARIAYNAMADKE